MSRYVKRGRLTLHTFYPVVKYMGAVLLALSYPRLNETTWLMPDVYGPRAFVMAAAAFLLLISLWLDRSYDLAEEKDLDEIRRHVRYGNMNRSTLLALSVPCMFVLDLLAILYLYLSYFRGGAGSQGGVSLSMHTAAMACGIVLFIYAGFLPRLSYGSIWGFKVSASMKSEDVWKRVHKSAAPCARLGGSAILIFSTFLSGAYALAAAAVIALVCLLRIYHIALRAR
ncbi:MAG: SdpI family protein [Clostridia bacterium]|nr:SdpI family protein [Clostridia bacterium]